MPRGSFSKRSDDGAPSAALLASNGATFSGATATLVGSGTGASSLTGIVFAKTAAASITHSGQTTNTPTFGLSMAGQSAFVTATGANKVGGVVTVSGGLGSVAGTDLNGAFRIGLGPTGGGTTAKLVVLGGAAGATSILEVSQLVNRVVVDASLASSLLRLNGPLGFELQVGAVSIADVGNTVTGEWAFVGASNVWFGAALSAPKLAQRTTLSDVATFNLTLSPQQPFATATGANRKPGDRVDAMGTPTNGGTTYGKNTVTWGTKDRLDFEDGHVQTTDATANVVIGVITLAANEVAGLIVMVCAREAATGDSKYGIIVLGAEQTGGTVTGLGASVPIATGGDAGAATWVINSDVNGATIRALATGQVAKTIEWSVKWIYGVLAP